ncbi:MAG: hypothetical protein ACRDWX_06880 [Acidimicrobiia bacterium]
MTRAQMDSLARGVKWWQAAPATASTDADTWPEARADIWRLMLGLCVGSMLLIPFNPVALTGDPAIYRAGVAQVFSGGIPYLEVDLEGQLPVSVLPMLAAWILGGHLGAGLYTVIFAVLMAACLLGTAFLVEAVGGELGMPHGGARFLILAGPVFSLVLFRLDPWAALLAAAALSAMVVDDQRRSFVLQVAAVLSKGWAVVFAAVEWIRGRRARAFALVGALVAVLAGLLLTPGFRAARAFGGIHTDTMVGSTLALVRTALGEPVGRFDAAGAIYLEAPAWAVPVNVNIGLVLATVALISVSAPLTRLGIVKLTGALVVALLIASPLLSPQFVIWPIPFLALHPSRLVRLITLAVASLTILFMLGWNPMYIGSLWWLPLVGLRNLALLALGVVTAWSVRSQDEPAPAEPR